MASPVSMPASAAASACAALPSSPTSLSELVRGAPFQVFIFCLLALPVQVRSRPVLVVVLRRQGKLLLAWPFILKSPLLTVKRGLGMARASVAFLVGRHSKVSQCV